MRVRRVSARREPVRRGRREIHSCRQAPHLPDGALGSRENYLIAYLTDAGVYVEAGCFFDTLDKFRDAVVKEHKDKPHMTEYIATTGMIEVHARLWMEQA